MLRLSKPGSGLSGALFWRATPHCWSRPYVLCHNLVCRRTVLTKHSVWILPVRRERVWAEHREEGGTGQSGWVGAKGQWVQFGVCVCVCVTQPAVSSLLCRYIQEKGFMLTCSCHCCQLHSEWAQWESFCFNMLCLFRGCLEGSRKILLTWQVLALVPKAPTPLTSATLLLMGV